MRTPARKNNPRASQRAERLRREDERRAQEERDRIAVYGPVDEPEIEIRGEAQTPDEGPFTPTEVYLEKEPMIVAASPPPAPDEDPPPITIGESTLEGLVREINVRLAKEDFHTRQAANHQVAVALRLAEAKAKCQAVKIPFKAWAEEYIKVRTPDGERPISYRQARLLATIGEATNPEEELEKVRGNIAERNRQLRARQREQRQISSPPPPPPPERAASRDTPTTDRPPEPGDIDGGFVENIPEKVDQRPLLNDRLGNVVAWIHDFQVPEIQLVVTEALSILTKGPAVEVLERAGFSVLDHRQTVSGD